MHFAAPFRACGALARLVAFVDDGAVEDVFAQGHEKVRAGVCGEPGGFEGGEGMEGWVGGGEEGVAVGGCGKMLLERRLRLWLWLWWYGGGRVVLEDGLGGRGFQVCVEVCFGEGSFGGGRVRFSRHCSSLEEALLSWLWLEAVEEALSRY